MHHCMYALLYLHFLPICLYKGRQSIQHHVAIPALSPRYASTWLGLLHQCLFTDMYHTKQGHEALLLPMPATLLCCAELNMSCQAAKPRDPLLPSIPIPPPSSAYREIICGLPPLCIPLPFNPGSSNPVCSQLLLLLHELAAQAQVLCLGAAEFHKLCFLLGQGQPHRCQLRHNQAHSKR